MRTGMICGMLAIAGILALSGCRTKIQPVAIENRIDSIYIDKLVPYPMPTDSASIRALMECDENRKVVLRWLDMANTKNVELMFALDSLGNVIASMRIPRDTLYLPSKEIYVDRRVEVPIPVEKELSKWVHKDRGRRVGDRLVIRTGRDWYRLCSTMAGL